MPIENERNILALVLPSKTERKAMLKALRTSKKLKDLDNPAIAQTGRITMQRDRLLLEQGKPSAETKACLKKAAVAGKKKRRKTRYSTRA